MRAKPRWLLHTLAALGLLVVVAGGVLLMTGTSPDDLVELVSEGSVVQLRDELRPARPDQPRVLVIALDGVGDGEFREAIRSGRMPNTAALLGGETGEDSYAHAYAPRGALSILPSTTYAAWTAVFTGQPVGRSGVSGNEWFDRETVTFVAPAPVSITEHRDAVRVYSDALMDRWIAVPTLFELADVRSYVTLAAQHRGADILVQPDFGLLGELVSAVAAGVGSDNEVDQESYGALDAAAAENTLAVIEDYGLADLQVIYFPGVDLYTHVAEPAIPEQLDYLADVLDPAIGALLEAYRARGALDSTFVVFVSDHGHTPTLDEERNALGTGDDGEIPDALRAAGFRPRPLELESGEEDFQAAVAYQGAFAYLYLADRSTCVEEGTRCDWRRPPRMDEDVLPVVRALERAHRDGTAAPKLRGTLDLIFARDARGIEEAEPFRIWNGERLVSVADYLAANPRPDLLDLEARLEDLAVGPYGHRAGDVMVLSRYRDVDPIEERFYFSKLYRSWHGSPSAQDSEILWVVARAGADGREMGERIRGVVGGAPSQLDITPVVLELLGRTDER